MRCVREGRTFPRTFARMVYCISEEEVERPSVLRKKMCLDGGGGTNNHGGGCGCGMMMAVLVGRKDIRLTDKYDHGGLFSVLSTPDERWLRGRGTCP